MKRRLLTSSEVAAELGLSRSSIARYATAGYITPEVTTPGGQYRWDLEKVREQLRAMNQRRRDEG